jgi:C1A family cysteine protease
MQYGKVYNGQEDDMRKATFMTNLQHIQEHNAKGESLQLGFNQFTDLSQAEYRTAAGLGYKPSAQRMGSLPNLGVHTYNGETLADTVDWSTQGAVTAVKDQGQCGSCWAFSTTGGLEGSWQIASGSLTSLSEQQFVDCDTADGNQGCNGGDMATAFKWSESTNVATESSYPYTGTDGSCKTSFTTGIPSGGVTGYKNVDQSTDALKSAITTGPVSVAIEADQIAFQLYSGGILANTGGLFGSCGTNLDHGVLAVGYGSNYFKVKNSWGASWGESGYLQISTDGNTCGIHSDAVYPVVSASVSV